jgi:hypothetical protein
MIQTIPIKQSANRGDTWAGYIIECVGKDFTGATISTSIRKLGDTKDAYPKLTLGSGMSLVGLATAGKVQVNSILNLPWAPGDYRLETQIVFADGTTKTWIRRTLTVENDDNK